MRADCIAAGSSELAGAQGDAHRANVLTPSRPTTNEPSRLLPSASTRSQESAHRGKSRGRWRREFMDCITMYSRRHTRHRPTPNTPTPHTDTATQTQTSTPNTAPPAPGPRARTCTHTRLQITRPVGATVPARRRYCVHTQPNTAPTPQRRVMSTWTTRAHRLRARLFCRVPQRRACLSGRAEMRRRRRLIATPVARVPRARGRPWRAPSTWRCG